MPIRHTLDAFNEVAKAGGHRLISAAEIDQLSTSRILETPHPTDTAADATYGRDLLLRRSAGQARATIFDGGHEGLARTGCTWLAQQKRRTESAVNPR